MLLCGKSRVPWGSQGVTAQAWMVIEAFFNHVMMKRMKYADDLKGKNSGGCLLIGRGGRAAYSRQREENFTAPRARKAKELLAGF